MSKLARIVAAAGGVSIARNVEAKEARELLSENSKETYRSTPSVAKHSYQIAPWTGDDFTLGHKLRHKDFPRFPDSPDAKVDFVIVGGGAAGLAAAHYLEHENYLLLEQYDELGGQSRGDVFNGLAFSYGSAQIADPLGALGELLSTLDLKPVRLETTGISWLWDSNWISGTGDKDRGSLHREFKRLMKDAEPVWQHCKRGNVFAPLADGQLVSLDNQPFSNCLTGYSRSFVELLDSYCKSALGAGTESVSALSGFAILNNIGEGSYALPGGNATIIRALAQRLLKPGKDRVATKTFVWSIELRDDYSLVSYSGGDGVCHKVQCKHVIITTPHLVSARILSNLNDRAKLQLFGFHYCSYLVATLLLKKSILTGGYAHFVPPTFTFSELAVAETPYKLKGKYKADMGAALTVLQPYAPASNGRALLLAGDRESFVTSIVEQVAKISDGLNNNLERVILTRWGHALAVAGPGYFSKLNQLQQAQGSTYSLAHSSAKGLPRIESAVAAAQQAVGTARKIKSIPTKLYSTPGSS